MAKTGGIDLSKLSIEELQGLARDIEEEVIARREFERERVLAQMRELAGTLGMTLEDFLRPGPDIFRRDSSQDIRDQAEHLQSLIDEWRTS